MTKEENEAMLRAMDAMEQAGAPAPAVAPLVTPELDWPPGIALGDAHIFRFGFPVRLTDFVLHDSVALP